MSFSFNFSGDDISDSEIEETTTNLAKTNLSSSTQSQSTRLLSLITPQRHTLPALLNSLPSQLTYNHLAISSNQSTSTRQSDSNTRSTNGSPLLTIPRRSLFDIRQQLMAESDPSDTTDSTNTLLAGLESGDLSTGIYEGGFKTWECAVDLASYVPGLDFLDALDQGVDVRVVELGAGSAIPSLVLLREVLRRRGMNARLGNGGVYGEKKREGKGRVRFTFCDYNEDVLRLCTAANVFLTTILSSQEDGVVTTNEDEDIDVDEDHIATCLTALEAAGISIDFISGAWGDQFVDILKQDTYQGFSATDPTKPCKTVVLASETIYSPDSLGVFTDTVRSLLDMKNEDRGTDVRVLVAAKKVYFGVGGGVAEFEGMVRQSGGRTDTVLDVKDAGVVRVVLEVRMA